MIEIRCTTQGLRPHTHASAAAARECWERTQEEQVQAAQERAAEDAWLRAAEAGNPDTWAETEREAQTDFYGYGPPPGF